MFDVDPQYQLLEFWKRAEGTFPIVAEMAREFLAIPASGVGVERLFNQARDICTYRRHRLKPETLRLLVMLMCMDSFNLKEEYRLSKTANELEDEWDFVSEDNEDMNEDENLSSYAISENEEDFEYVEDQPFHDSADFQPLSEDLFDLQHDNIFDLPDADMYDDFDLPDDLEAALRDASTNITQQIAPAATVADSAASSSIQRPTRPARTTRQSAPEPAGGEGPVTRQRSSTLHITPRRSLRADRKT